MQRMKTMINKIKGTAMMLTAMMMAVAAFTACSSEEMAADGTAAKESIFTVGEYPAYASAATTRTIGTADAGKTEWAADDVILVKAEQYSGYDDATSAVSGTLGTTTLFRLTCTAAASAGTAATWSTQQWDATNSTWTSTLTANAARSSEKYSNTHASHVRASQ